MKVCGYIAQNLTQNQLNYKKINSRDIPGVYIILILFLSSLLRK